MTLPFMAVRLTCCRRRRNHVRGRARPAWRSAAQAAYRSVRARSGPDRRELASPRRRARAIARATQAVAAAPISIMARAGSARGTLPVARAKTRSPSKGVCTGQRARAKPLWLTMREALRLGLARESASVATTARVVLARIRRLELVADRRAARRAAGHRAAEFAADLEWLAQKCGPSPMVAWPTALTAAIAPTVTPFSSFAEAEPSPPFSVAVVAPVPAPTEPRANFRAAAVERCPAEASIGAVGRPNPCRRHWRGRKGPRPARSAPDGTDGKATADCARGRP